MRVCLIEPPSLVSLTNVVSTICPPPLGLAYIAAALREAGHLVTVVDGTGAALRNFYTFRQMRVRGLSVAAIVERIPRDTEVIGLGCMFSPQWLLVRELVEAIRAGFPRALLIMGGEHVSAVPELALKQAPLDAVVMGEGEAVVVRLLDRHQRGTPLEGLEGVAFRRGDGSVQCNPRRPRIRDIDAIAWPAWDLFDLDAYNEVNQPHGASRGRFMPMLATRGCPFRCTFCTSPQMWTTRWVARAVTDVVDEMQHYHQRHGVTDFQFEDLTAIVSRSWTRALCDEIERRGMQVTFQLPSGTRSEALDADLAARLKRAGCHELTFAPESGDPRLLESINKRVELPALYRAADSAMQAGIAVGAFFIIGFPQESYESILRTYGAIVACAWRGFANVNLNAYAPHPNTESFRALRDAGAIPDLDDNYLLGLFASQDFGARKTSYCPRLGHLELSLLVILGQGLFYVVSFARRPGRVVELLADLGTSSSRNKSHKIVKSVLKDSWSMATARVRRLLRHLGRAGRSTPAAPPPSPLRAR